MKNLAILISLLIANSAYSASQGLCDGSLNPSALPNGSTQKNTSAFENIRQAVEVDLKSQDALKATGDFVHRIWQKTNSYRTRYKNIVDENGKKVTDIREYISSHDVPAEIRIHYRQALDGTYQEDIKYIDNSKLSPENAQENFEGGKDYLANISRFLSKAIDLAQRNQLNVDELVAQIHKILQEIHSEWLDRNDKKWGARQYNPENINEMSPALQYNNFAIFNMLLKKYVRGQNLKSSELDLVLNALNQVDQSLLNLVLAPYKGLTPGEAYLKMSQTQGTKASLGLEGISNFYDKLMKKTKLGAKKIDTLRGKADLEKVKFQHENILKSEIVRSVRPLNNLWSDLRLVAPNTAAGSGAIVYLVKRVSTKEVVAVLKVQSKKTGGLDEILSTLSLNALLQGHKNSDNLPTVYNYGKLNENDYYLLISPAKEKDVDGWLKQLQGQNADPVLISTAKALAELHGPFLEKYEKDELRTFQGNSFYDVKIARQNTGKGKEDTFRVAVERGDLTEIEAEELRRKTKSIISEYEEIIESHPKVLGPALVHGDFHGGNLFFNAQNDRTTLIDYATMTYFLSQRENVGTGDRGNDVGRMIAHIFVEGIKENINPSESRRMAQVILKTYLNETHPSSENKVAFLKSATFYSLIFLSIQARDIEGKKFKSHQMNLTELRKKLFTLWPTIIDFYMEMGK